MFASVCCGTYNNVLKMLQERKLLFPSSIINTCGKTFVSTLVDCLWYLDGHHDASFLIPEVFSAFTGYNLPELSKHHKRQAGNMCSDILKSLAQSLFDNLQSSFWKKASWKWLQIEVTTLATSISGYADYLSTKNKAMKMIHARDAPVRQFSDSISVKIIKPCI